MRGALRAPPTLAQGGWLGQLRAQGILPAHARVSVSEAQGTRGLRQGPWPAGGQPGCGDWEPGSLHPLPSPRLLFATDGKWQLRKQRFLALPDHSWENRWSIHPTKLGTSNKRNNMCLVP